MKVQYEVGDIVYESPKYGTNPLTVVKVNKLGVTVRSREGATFYLGCRQVEPTPPTVLKAKWIKT